MANGTVPEAEWLERFDKGLASLRVDVSSLTAAVATVTAHVDTLSKQQGAIFQRQNRPFHWGWFLSAVVLVVMGAGLLVAPMQREDEQLRDAILALTQNHNEHTVNDAYKMGVHDTNLKWLEMMEDRLNRRIHREKQE